MDNRKVLEGIEKRYVVASIDRDNTTVYLNYRGGNTWEITPNIVRASKMYNRETARIVLDDYRADMQNDDEFVIIPLVMEYYLINETKEEGEANVNSKNDSL